MTQAQRDINRKFRVLNYVKETGNVLKACRCFGISLKNFQAEKVLREI